MIICVDFLYRFSIVGFFLQGLIGDSFKFKECIVDMQIYNGSVIKY